MASEKNKARNHQAENDKESQRRELRRNQVFGLILGLIGAAMTGNFWPAIPASMPMGWGGLLMWGAVIGSAVGSLAQFERAGKVLTRRDNRVLNMTVGIGVPLLIIGALAYIVGAF